MAVFSYAPYEEPNSIECDIKIDVILTVSKTITIKAEPEYIDENCDATTAYFGNDCVEIPDIIYAEMQSLGYKVDDADFELLTRAVTLHSRID